MKNYYFNERVNNSQVLTIDIHGNEARCVGHVSTQSLSFTEQDITVGDINVRGHPWKHIWII